LPRLVFCSAGERASRVKERKKKISERGRRKTERKRARLARSLSTQQTTYYDKRYIAGESGRGREEKKGKKSHKKKKKKRGEGYERVAFTARQQPNPLARSKIGGKKEGEPAKGERRGKGREALTEVQRADHLFYQSRPAERRKKN